MRYSAAKPAVLKRLKITGNNFTRTLINSKVGGFGINVPEQHKECQSFQVLVTIKA